MAYPLYDCKDKCMKQTAFTFKAVIASAVFQDEPDMYELVIKCAVFLAQLDSTLAHSLPVLFPRYSMTKYLPSSEVLITGKAKPMPCSFR